MATIQLGYGRGTIPFEFEGGRFEVLEGEAGEERPLTDAEIGAVIDDPFDSQPLEEARKLRRWLSDARAAGNTDFNSLQAIERELVRFGV